MQMPVDAGGTAGVTAVQAGSAGRGGAVPSTGTAGASVAGDGGSVAGASADAPGPDGLIHPVDESTPWEPTCPDGFMPAAGMNSGFDSDGIERQFSVSLPSDADLQTPRPVFLALTGTDQTEMQFLTQSTLNNLPRMGWIVLSPVRRCSMDNIGCNGWGEDLTKDGRLWEPWFDGSTDDTFRQDQGPDVRFFEAMVKCAAMKWPVDPKRIYLGGISAGGTITNRNMTFNSDFYAGGIDASGSWYGVVGAIRPQSADKVEDPQEGWCCPRPLHVMDSSIVIVIWGGANDRWSSQSAMVDVDFGPETKRAAHYYSTQSKVVTVSCFGNHGHNWPTSATNWFISTLTSFPKGTDPATFQLTPAPSGLNCVVGEYEDQ